MTNHLNIPELAYRMQQLEEMNSALAMAIENLVDKIRNSRKGSKCVSFEVDDIREEYDGMKKEMEDDNKKHSSFSTL